MNLQKKDIVEELTLILNKKIEALTNSICDAKESQANDTKSSAGDKFETGREMIQIEIAKQESQRFATQKLLIDLQQISLEKICSKAEFGSLVKTDKNTFFLSVPYGQVSVKNCNILAISLASPFGKELHNKKVGDSFLFQNNTHKITSIL